MRRFMEILRKLIEEQRVEMIVKLVFPTIHLQLTPKQYEIVKTIGWAVDKRVCINAMTRYGKSQAVAIGVCLYILLHNRKRVALIAPTGTQSNILRNYIAEMMLQSPMIMEIIELERTGVDKIKKEASRTRQTFRNGCEYQIFSAAGEADRLMGFGADMVITDESCLIPEVAWAKITRMLGDDPEHAVLIELANPWDMATRYYKHWISGRYKKIHIGYEEAIAEGRITSKFVEEQRKELTPLEFEVLYESNFPLTSEDAVFNYGKVQEGVKKEIPEWEEWENYEKIISCDVADKGLDWTVIYWGVHNLDTDEYCVLESFSEPKSDNMQVAYKIFDWYNEKGADRINIDTIGVGVGVVSRVRELVGDLAKVVACHYGEGVGTAGKETRAYPSETLQERRSDSIKKRFLNRKAEQFFRLKDLFSESLMNIPDNDKLIMELMSMKWDFSTSSKIKIIDPDLSPNWADCLTYFVWKTEQDVYFDFGEKE